VTNLSDAELDAELRRLNAERRRRNQLAEEERRRAELAEQMRPRWLVGMRVSDVKPGMLVWRVFGVAKEGQVSDPLGFDLTGDTIVHVEQAKDEAAE
jgi:hypothetical protein